MALQLSCPCGTRITAYDDDFVATVQAHLAAEHPDRSYSADEILAFAMPVDDKWVG